MFMLFEYMFPIIFVIVFGMIIFQFVTGIRTWHKNNQSPRLSVSATIVAKRENITHHSHANAGDLSGAHGFHSTSSTSYYVTFQVESGDRMELQVSGREYGMLAEGDICHLSACDSGGDNMKKRFIMLGIVCLFMTGCQTAQKTIPEITTIAPADSAHEETETNKEERAEDASVAVKSLKIGSSKGNPDDLSSL